MCNTWVDEINVVLEIDNFGEVYKTNLHRSLLRIMLRFADHRNLYSSGHKEGPPEKKTGDGNNQSAIKMRKIRKGKFKGSFDTRSFRCINRICQILNYPRCEYCRVLPYVTSSLQFENNELEHDEELCEEGYSSDVGYIDPALSRRVITSIPMSQMSLTRIGLLRSKTIDKDKIGTMIRVTDTRHEPMPRRQTSS